MDINRVKYFRAIYETGSIRRAAEILHLTPGALSKSVGVLEDELGVKIFVPQGRNIVASEAGKKFYALSYELIAAHTNLLASLTAEREKIHTIKLASWEVFTTYFMSELVTHCFPGRPLRLLERAPGDLERAICEGEADIGITYAPLPQPELHFMRVAQIAYKTFAKKGAFGGCSLPEIPFAVPITKFPESPSGTKTLDNWPSQYDRTILYEFEMLETALQVCRLGHCAIYCPTFIAKLHNNFVTKTHHLVEISEQLRLPKNQRDVFLVKRKTDPEKEIPQMIGKFFRETFC